MPNIDTLSIQFNANGTDKAVNNIKAMGYAVRNLAQSVKSIDSSKLGAFTSSMETLKKSIPTEAQTKRMSAFSNAIKELSGVIGTANISGFSRDMSTLGDAVNTFKRSSVNSITNAVTAMQNLQSQTQATAKTISNAVPKSSVPIERGNRTNESLSQAKELIATLDKVQIKATGIQGVFQKMGLVVPTKRFKDLENSAEKVRQKYEEVRSALQKGLNEGSLESGGTEYKKKMAELDALRNKYNELIQKQRELAKEGGGFTLAPGLKQAASSAKAIDSSFRSLSGALGTVSKKFSSIISKVRSFGSHAKSTKRDTSSLADAAKKLSNEFFRVSKMLKLMITRMALRAVIKELGNGFKSLALHSEEFNNSVSGMMNASKQLGYSISAMVSPLINAFAPAIIYVINLLIKLANVIQQVFGALTGATTWNKAKDFTESWADNIKAANKGAKELKKTVLGFDELNQLQEKTSGGGGNDIVDMFDTQQIDSKWKSLADTIKKYANKLFDPIKKAWEKVGNFVKKSWKYAMDEVLKLGSSVARDFWKMWEQKATQQIFENILKIVGYIGQTVGNLARQFRIAWDENNTGYKILCNIRDVVLTITEHLKNMAKATADWADTLDFSPILTKFNEWLESIKPVVDNLMGIVEDFYTTVILPLGKWAVEVGGPKLLQVFIDFNEKVDWEGLRQKLQTLWEHLEPFMETVGEGLIIFIDRVAQALADFINSPEFEQFLKDVEDWMDSVTPQDVADGLEAIAKAIIAFAIGKTVIDGLIAISSFLKLVSSLAPLLKLALVISVAYTGFKLGSWIGKKITGDDETYDNFTWSAFIDVTVRGVETWEDFAERLTELADAWMTMRKEADWFIQSIMRIVEGPVASFVLDLFGITEATKKASEESVGYKEKLEELTEKTKNLKAENENSSKSFSETVEGLKKASGEASTATTSFSKAAENIKNVGTESNNAASSFIKVHEGIKDVNTSAEDLSKGYNNLKTNTDSLKTALNDANTAYKNVKGAMEQTVSYTPVMTDSQKKIVDSLSGLKKETEEVQLATANAGLDMQGTWTELSKSTNTNMGDIKKSVDESMKDVNKSLDTVKDAMSEKEWTFDGVGSGLTKTFEKAKEGIKGVWNSIAEKLNGEHSLGEGKFKINLPKFATGGFPEDGLFMANHNELVGHFSNGKTAVANNQQIIAGIETGVYAAVSKALSQNNGGSQYIANEIIVDGDVIARSVSKAQERQGRRYSPSMA